MYASRNIKLCTKDCICLFICPTGATNTETGQIDKDKCIDGCRKCVDACPSHAISLVFEEYPEPKAKDSELAESMKALLESKSSQELILKGIAEREGKSPAGRLARALQESCRIVGEDCAREVGYLLPQCQATRDLLEELNLDKTLAE